jgi:hypothetical protein
MRIPYTWRDTGPGREMPSPETRLLVIGLQGQGAPGKYRR